MSAVIQLAGASLLAMAGATIATPALAQTAQENQGAISLPAMSLDRALDRIAAQANVAITFDRADAARYGSPAITAATPAEAIQRALSNAPLSMDSQGTGFIVGRPSESDRSEIVVTARRDEAETDYGARTASSATRDGATLRSQPQSTTVITAKVLADQQIQNVSDALRNASGATVNIGNVQGAVNYAVRGFNVTPTSNGLISTGANSLPIANVERIEVLKGPAAILAGQDNLGGVVNIVYKKPSADPILDIGAEYGSHEDIKGTIDGSTALSSNKAVSARLVLSAAHAGRNFVGYDGRREYLVAPSLRYKLDDSDYILGGSLSRQAGPIPSYAYFNDARELIDVSDRLIGPRNQGVIQENAEIHFEGSQGVTDWLTLVGRGQYTANEQTLRIFAPAGFLDTDLLVFSKFSNRQQRTSYGIDTYARLKFSTFAARHTLVVGYNYGNSANLAFTVPSLGSDPTFSVKDLSQPFTVPAFRYPSVAVNRGSTIQNGYYAQDLIEFGPVHLSGGVRKTEVANSAFFFSGSRLNKTERGGTVPNVGVVVDLSRQVSVYANYLEGFFARTILDRNGDILPNQSSENYEAGVKADLIGGRLSVVASVFRLREYGLSLSDPDFEDASIPIPGQESRGFEIDVNGRIAPGWQIAASYSYAKFKQLDPVDNDPVLAQPKHKYSLFTTYEVQDGPLASLGAGIGIYGFSNSLAGFDRELPLGQQAYILPAQTQVDANLYYTLGKFRLNLGVSNVLNDTIFGVASNTTYVPRREPRQFRFTVIYKMF